MSALKAASISFKIGKLLGIPIYIHITFLLLIPVLSWYFAKTSYTLFGFTLGYGAIKAPIEIKYLFGIIASILLFTCVLLHELGHSYVAQKNGIPVRSITLLILGGMAAIEEIPKDYKIESKMAAIGPLISISIGIISYALYILINPYGNITIVGYIIILLGILAFYNILMGLFNLIPAYPMDGGRLLRAYFAKYMPYVTATEKASYIGKIFAIIMGTIGIFINLWLVLIAFFIYIGASEEEKITKISITLEGIKVRDMMTKDVQTVPSEMTVSELVDLMFKQKFRGYPVKNNKLEGVVTFSDVRKIPKTEHYKVKVRDIMSKNILTVSADIDAIECMKLFAKHNVGRFVVMEKGKMVGIITRTDMGRVIEIKGVSKG
ncbi:MAG TPA: CBS domain-containing protein [Methanosarcinales archaeon]|nr:CBS domain-containing protein [Methanosarcinales archaeon]